jgi:two-component system, chemotaxis family, sensor kinase CheA
MDTSEYLGMFLAESREHLQTLNLAVIRIEETPSDAATIDEIFRTAHSLKGMSGTMGFAGMAALTHTMEDVFETMRGRVDGLERGVIDVLLECLDALERAVDAIEREGAERLDATALIARLNGLLGERAPDDAAGSPTLHVHAAPQARPTAATVRVDAVRLDRLMHHMGELVVHRSRVEALAHGSGIDGLAEAVADLTRSSQSLQALVLQVRMIAVDAVFMRFPRLIRDLSTKTGKQVDLVLTGRDTELDRTVVDALGDPLMHLVRNALDHALESPAEREAAGKPATGVLELRARQAGGNVIISVRDDGRGIDPEAVAQKAHEHGLISAQEVGQIDMSRAIELVFTPGLSTAGETSDMSGRGVGMDAARAVLRGLGGAVVVTSEQGRGTTVEMRLPLTLAVRPALREASGPDLADAA